MHTSNTLTPPVGGHAGESAPPAVPAVPGVPVVPDVPLLERSRVAGLSDEALLAVQGSYAELRRQTDANLALLADEVARRSHHSLGHAGLAQRLGSRTPQKLVQQLVGGSARDAAALVRVGSLLTDSVAAPDHDAGDAALAAAPEPWLRSVADAIAEARLGVDAGDAIARGLGQPDSLVTSDHLAAAATQLVAEAVLLTVEQLAVRARDARALLDLDLALEADIDSDPGRIEQRELELRERRYLHLSRHVDGMTRLSGLLDPESAALVRDAVDAATSPRRGGPRFLDAAERDRAERMLRDSRTTEQLALDALVELIRLGGAVAPVDLIGVRAPAVQVIVTERDLRAGRGLARLEGQTEPLTTTSAERHVCSSGIVPIVIDDSGDVIALGRESRLYTRRQRIALAARDGGCRFPGCERPPSWTEAHHIVPWSEGGTTDLRHGPCSVGITTYSLHNNGWRFARVDGALHVIPPPDIDAEQRPIPAPSKSPPLERARAG